MLIWELFRILFCFFFLYILVFWSWSMRDLSSLTTNQTHTPCIGRWSLNHWTAREVPGNGLGTLCVSAFCGDVYYFRSQLHRILPRDLRAHSKSWFETIVQAPDGRCRGGIGRCHLSGDRFCMKTDGAHRHRTGHPRHGRAGSSGWGNHEASWTSAPWSVGKETFSVFYSDSGQSK